MLMNLDFISFITFNIWFMLTFKPTQIRSSSMSEYDVHIAGRPGFRDFDWIAGTVTRLDELWFWKIGMCLGIEHSKEGKVQIMNNYAGSEVK